MSHVDRPYRPDIDGLRALAVVVVLFFHAFPARLPGGFVGVDVFFVISGYLISGIILDARAAGRFTFAGFYARRIRRIFPALAVVLAAVLAGGWFLLYADDYARVGYHAAAGAGFVSNIAFWSEASYFDVAAELKPLLHLWSLGVEEQFYLVWPVILVVATRWRRGPLAATLAIGTVSFLLSIWTVRIDRTPAFYAPWNRFWELLAGATLACIEADAYLVALQRRLTAQAWLANACSVIGLVSIGVGILLIDSTRVFPGLWVLLPVGGTALLILAGPQAVINHSILSMAPMVWVGLISYPLYLWHWPLLSFAHIRLGDIPPTPLRLTLLAVSVVLAWITYRVVERPIRFGGRIRLAVPALGLAMAAAGAAGVAVYVQEGVLDRAVNRNDAARLVDYYERVRRKGLAEAYRYQCDFMAADGSRKESLDPICTTEGRARTVFLWGDSYAQALSLGIRENLPADTALAQVTTSGCSAAIDNFDLTVRDRRCEYTNLFAMDNIRKLRPEVVIVAQAGGQTLTDWPALTSHVLSLGARQVVVVGPFPLWEPTLPRVYAEHHIEDHADYVSAGLNKHIFENDRTVRARVEGLPNVTYLSLLEQLCPPSRFERFGETSRPACLARVPGEGEFDLMAVDFGHLSPKGSSYVGRTIWKPYFDRVLAPLPR
jgi:peptidoglycan/LPS O-acetylase OafA/YrhL